MINLDNSFTLDAIHNGAGYEALVEVERHGIGHWEYWSDTGAEFTETQQPRLLIVEVLNDQGEVVDRPDPALLDSMLEVAFDRYWTLANEGEFS